MTDVATSDMNFVKITDDRIANTTDKLSFAIYKGGQQVTSAKFSATSEGANSCIYNIQVPSLETHVDRAVLWTATVTLRVTGVSQAGVSQLLSYGNRDCLGPFPLHSMCQSMTATINNNTISCNIKEVLPALLRMLNDDELAAYNSTTPTAYDQYLKYDDMVGGESINNSFNGFYDCTSTKAHPRGSFTIDSIKGPDGIAPMVAGQNVAIVKFTVTEPLLLSPFIFNGNVSSNNGAMYGIQNMAFNFNMGYSQRVWRHSNNGGGINQSVTNVEIIDIKNSSLQFFFLTCHPSDRPLARCVTPFYEMPRYVHPFQIGLCVGDGLNGVPFQPANVRVESPNISLNQVPDRMIVYCHKRNKNWNDPDSFLTIKNISINFNNYTGVCSSFSQQQLWQCSKQCGSNQSWDEFRGVGYNSSIVANEGVAGNGAGQYIRTSGSMLLLEFGRHINLVEDWYAPSSIGSFNLQYSLDVENYDTEAGSVDCELVLITMNSGSFVCQLGTSSTFTSVLNKQIVGEVSGTQGGALSTSDSHRMVGGGFLDNLKSVFRWVASPQHRKDLGSVIRTGMDIHDIYTGAPSHEKSRNVLGKLGGSRSGGGLTSRIK